MSGQSPELRAHKVARAAYQRIEARVKVSYHKRYGSLAYRLPGMILQNGLAQATGFLLAKGKDEHKEEYKALLDDLVEVMRAAPGATSANSRDELHQEIIAADLQATLRLTRSALEASGWMKRYVQGLMGVDVAHSGGPE